MRRFLGLGLKIAISAALIYLALRSVDLGTFLSRLNQIDLSWIVATVVILLLQSVILGLRWREIVGQSGASIGVEPAVRYSLVSQFFSQTLPSTVGGDAARVWLLARDGAGWQRATYSVLADRGIGLLSLAVLVGLCLPWTLQLIQQPTGRLALLAIAAVTIGGSFGFLLLGLPIWRRLGRIWVIRHLTGVARVVCASLFTPRVVAGVAPLSFAIHLLTVSAVWCTAKAAGAPLDFAQALFLVPPVVLVATVPISIAGWGVREGAMMTAFAYAGLSQADGLMVSLLYGGAVFAVGALGGLIWVVGSERLPAGGFALPAEGDASPTRGGG